MSDVDTPDLDTNAIPGANPDTNAAIAERENRWLVPTYGHIPMALVRGEDCHVWDAEGNRYLDLYGGHCVASVGHCHPKLVAAIQSQAAKLIFYSNVVYNDARAEAAEAIASIAPEGLQRIFFCNSGTEANETALKIARSHTGRRHVISMQKGFHGRTLGSLGITGPDKYRDPTWPVPEEHIRVPFGNFGELHQELGDHIAAVFVEPIPSQGGIQVADEDYYSGLRSLCDAAGALLVFDEVQTGFGRTGTWFFGEQMGVTPDLITGAKGVAGGVPAGLVLVREDIADTIQPGDHGTTFGGGPLASAAMAAVVDILKTEQLPERAKATGAWLASQLVKLDGVRGVSGRGLLLGVDLDRAARPVVAALREQSILVGACDGDPDQLRLLPPLTLTEALAEPFVAALEQALS